jgi:hypothetical protein
LLILTSFALIFKQLAIESRPLPSQIAAAGGKTTIDLAAVAAYREIPRKVDMEARKTVDSLDTAAAEHIVYTMMTGMEVKYSASLRLELLPRQRSRQSSQSHKPNTQLPGKRD